MTESEEIRFQEAFYMMVNSEKGKEACKIAIFALKEVGEYLAIGTVESCRKAVEKQKAEVK